MANDPKPVLEVQPQGSCIAFAHCERCLKYSGEVMKEDVQEPLGDTFAALRSNHGNPGYVQDLAGFVELCKKVAADLAALVESYQPESRT